MVTGAISLLHKIYLQEELNVALFHIRDMSNRQREAQRRMELLQIESNKDIIPLPHRSSSRKNSRADMVAPSEAEHICTTNQSELSVYQNFFPTLPQGESPQRSNTSTQTSTSDQEAQQQQQKPPTWAEKTNSRDQMEISNNQTENSKKNVFQIHINNKTSINHELT
ncbi:hypothetical protein GOODEAATRI_032593 [Goodea atripinnis]|uniref:Uncharacterized protein n=1 Tax=Goodea atripinnis TaxID=208336 RepID=A0ABV0PTG9_9TELE